MPCSGIPRSYNSSSFFFFKGNSVLSSRVAVSIYIPISSATLFSTSSPAFIVCRFFDDGHSDWCEVMSRNSFDLHLSNSEHCGASVHVFISHLYVYFGEMSV